MGVDVSRDPEAEGPCPEDLRLGARRHPRLRHRVGHVAARRVAERSAGDLRDGSGVSDGVAHDRRRCGPGRRGAAHHHPVVRQAVLPLREVAGQGLAVPTLPTPRCRRPRSVRVAPLHRCTRERFLRRGQQGVRTARHQDGPGGRTTRVGAQVRQSFVGIDLGNPRAQGSDVRRDRSDGRRDQRFLGRRSD